MAFLLQFVLRRYNNLVFQIRQFVLRLPYSNIRRRSNSSDKRSIHIVTHISRLLARISVCVLITLLLTLVVHSLPAQAIFEGAKKAAEGGIGEYIGTDEATSLIDTLLFAVWALAAVGGLAAIAGGVLQQIQVLVGGLLLFFGMAVLVGILEFTDNLLFQAALYFHSV